MSNDKIEIVKLVSGDYIIGKYETHDDISVTLNEPRIIVMLPTRTGEMGVMFKPVCFPWTSQRLKDKIVIKESQIVFHLYDYENEIEKQFIDGYLAEISGIQIASTADMNEMTGQNPTDLIV